MRVVLRHRKTGEFFKSPGQWTENVEEAFQFEDAKSANEFYMRHYLPDAEVTLLSSLRVERDEE